jgi:hypothetical protein
MEQVNPIRRRLLRCAGIGIGIIAGAATLFATQSSGPRSEYEVKAAFLLNFTRFIEWPPEAFADEGGGFSICVLGEDPFQNALDQVVEGESVRGRRVVVSRVKRPPGAKSCQVLFIGKGEKDVSGILSGVGPGVLTVGEQPGFLRDGGIINFALEGRHVRFDINQRAAANASLTISARLLNVARTVQK